MNRRSVAPQAWNVTVTQEHAGRRHYAAQYLSDTLVWAAYTPESVFRHVGVMLDDELLRTTGMVLPNRSWECLPVWFTPDGPTLEPPSHRPNLVGV